MTRAGQGQVQVTENGFHSRRRLGELFKQSMLLGFDLEPCLVPGLLSCLSVDL